VREKRYFAVESWVVRDDDEVIYGVESKGYRIEGLAGGYINAKFHRKNSDRMDRIGRIAGLITIL
jgi:hypothetical protein